MANQCWILPNSKQLPCMPSAADHSGKSNQCFHSVLNCRKQLLPKARLFWLRVKHSPVKKTKISPAEPVKWTSKVTFKVWNGKHSWDQGFKWDPLLKKANTLLVLAHKHTFLPTKSNHWSILLGISLFWLTMTQAMGFHITCHSRICSWGCQELNLVPPASKAHTLNTELRPFLRFQDWSKQISRHLCHVRCVISIPWAQ